MECACLPPEHGFGCESGLVKRQRDRMSDAQGNGARGQEEQVSWSFP
jgi:hypothetical protein